MARVEVQASVEPVRAGGQPVVGLPAEERKERGEWRCLVG